MTYQIPFYKAERDAGLSDVIWANAAVIAYATRAEEEVAPKKRSERPLFNTTAVAVEQSDLFYLKDILVTTCKNKNDDIFLKEEVWPARATPEDKPFNLEHNQKEIIGHITGGYAIDDNQKIIEDGCAIDELPNKFHIVSNSVIYAKYADKEYEKKITDIIAEIKKGDKWYVSMEATFSNFDYGVVDEAGTASILTRRDKTAFLTKHLRAYGGTGKYENYQIGRVLRNIVFSGKGLVLRPANPESIIFADTQLFEVKAGYEISVSDIKKPKESSLMAGEVDNKSIENLQAALKDALAGKADAEKRLQELDSKAVQAKLDGLTADVKIRDEKIGSLNEVVKSLNETKATLEKNLADSVKNHDVLKAELKTIQDAKLKADRVAKAMTDLELSAEDAAEVVGVAVDFTDEKFTQYIEAAKKVKGKKPAMPPTGDCKTAADSKALANATPVVEPPLVTTTAGNANNGVEEVRASITKYVKSRRSNQEESETEK